MEEQNNFKLNELAVSAVRESAKWCMFLAIVGFIFIGLMVVAGLFMAVAMSAIPDDPYGGGMGMDPFSAIKSYLGAVYIVMALIYFFPVYYLFNYAKKMKEALQSFNENILADALVNLKSHHKFLGIFTIVMIAVYIIAIIAFVGVFASMAGGGM
ncbi:hypothetical protein [Flavobacterium sp. 25HG05S-40]|uniref:hypothetical protein n=1 Tax=Flavobacterium sp. 25HG05S-40 TaxID=3458682 RepID=UPI004044B59A